MAITSITERFQRAGSVSKTSMDTARQFDILCDDRDNDTPIRILQATSGDIPYGSVYPEIGQMYPARTPGSPTAAEAMLRCTDRRLVEGHYPRFVVECAFHADMSPYSESPLEEYPETSWDSSDSSEPVDTDIHGNPIQMSNQEGLDPKLTRQVSDSVLKINANVVSWDDVEWGQPWRNTVGDAELVADYVWEWDEDLEDWVEYAIVFPSGSSLIKKVSGARVLHGSKVDPDFVYYKVSALIQFRTDLDPLTGEPVFWKRRVRDEGFRELTGYDSDGFPSYDDIKQGDQTVTRPVPLNGAGLRKKEGEDPYWHHWEIEGYADHRAFFDYLGIYQDPDILGSGVGGAGALP